MNKCFGFWTLTFLVIANMIGAGVFTTSGFAVQDLSSPNIVLLAWFAGGVIAMAGAFSYGLLTEAMPESGGRVPVFVTGSPSVARFYCRLGLSHCGFLWGNCIFCFGFRRILAPRAGNPSWFPAGTLAVAVIILAGVIHGLKPRAGAFIQNSVVLLKLVLLVAILVFAATKIPTNDWKGVQATEDQPIGWRWSVSLPRVSCGFR